MSIETPAAAPAIPVVPVAVKPPRFWPAAVLVGLYWLMVALTGWLELPTFFRFLPRLAGAVLLPLTFFGWWWANRRVRLSDRAFGFAVVVGLGAAVAPLVHPSCGGMSLLMFGLPVALTAWTAGMLLARSAPPARQRRVWLAAVALAWGSQTLMRMNGLTGDLHADVRWRWSPTAEEQFLAEKAQSGDTGSATAAPVVFVPGDWPGFRGPDRDGVVRGGVSESVLTAAPRLIWKQRVGPAWSSVAVVGGRLFTQEQRGDQEAVVSYDAATGQEVWSHTDAARFEEGVSGTGPRATPTFADGRIYALGGTGRLSCLDAATGRRLWSRDITADSGGQAPQWGFSSSPLVVGGVVIVFGWGDGEKSLLGYRADSGELAWAAPAGAASYGSAQFATLAGWPQVLFFSDRGLIAVDPATGAVLWRHDIPTPGAPRNLQPHVVGPGQILVASEADLGTALIDVSYDGQQWATAQRWASKHLKPSFNDFVIHGGHVYGFDGSFFACIDLATGRRAWKEGRYGHGQVVLLADQGLLLVTSESGEVVLLAANPQRSEERGRFKAIEGKTWNHPVIAHGRLYVRNAEEMACYEVGG